MIGAITLLLVFQLIGEVIAQALAVPVPGPVIGMALLFLALVLRGDPSTELRGTAQGLPQHLSLLFIPAATGVMLHIRRMSDGWLPLLLAVAALVALLSLTGTPYRTYFDGAQFVHFLLGPATVALAIPLYGQLDRLKRMALPLLGALLVGSLTAALSAVAIGALLGASRTTLLSLAPKSVTTPIAMGIAERIGGLPSLTAVLVIATGIIGAIGARYIYRLLRIEDEAVRGFALGIASHGIGTARAFQESEQAGAFAALAMGLNGLMTALLLPIVMPWVMA